jgi:hypothetical protein
MSATSQPFGLRPAFFPTGLERAQALYNGIPSGYATNIFKGSAVLYTPGAGVIQPVTATSDKVTGSFQGVQWTDTTQRLRVSNYWPANTPYITGAAPASQMIAYFYNDQQIVYEIQTDGPVSQTIIGNECNFSNINAGNTTTGLSSMTLSATPVGSGVQGQVRVVDISFYPDNAWGDPYVIVRVQMANTQFVAPSPAI